MAGNIRVPVPFETLLEADAEESPQTEAEVRAARHAYESEDYVGFDEYVSRRRGED